MKVMHGGRGCGKTYALIAEAAKSHAYIVCPSFDDCRRIADQAEAMGVKIPFPIAPMSKQPSKTERQLMMLVDGLELPGRDVAKRFESETGKRISYGTLYVAFRRLEERGWVRTRDVVDADGRTRFFILSENGRNALSEA